MRILLLLFIYFPILLQAQSDSCKTLPLFFNQIVPDSLINVDSFCLALNPGNSYPHSGQALPGCGIRWSVDNPAWYNFIAMGTEITIDIQTKMCYDNTGYQVAVYELPKNINYHPDSPGINPELLGAELVSNCDLVACTINPRNLSISTTPCKYYGILFDGCDGDICHLKVTTEVSGEIVLLDTFTIDSIYSSQAVIGNLSDTLCPGAMRVPFYIDPIPTANRALWKLNDSIVFNKSIYSKLYLDFPDTGQFELCIAAANDCDTTDYTCTTINVDYLEIDTIVTTDTVCEGNLSAWYDPYDRLIQFYWPVDSGNLQFDTVSVNQNLCELPLRLDLWVINENDEAPIQLDTVVCFTDVPLKIGENYFFEPDSNKLFSVLDTKQCETFYNMNLTLFGGEFHVTSKCDGQQNVKFSFKGRDEVYYTPWEEQFEKMARDSTYLYMANWFVDSQLVASGQNLNLVLSELELDTLSEGDDAIIELQVNIYKDSVLMCTSSSDYIYQGDPNYINIHTDIKIIGDSLLVVEDSMASYQWVNCDSNFTAIPGANSQIYKPEKDGNYAVFLEKGICEVFSDCIYYSTTTATSEQTHKSLRIIPNPTSGQFKIDPIPSSLLGEQYSIYSMTGDLLMSNRLHEQSIFDLSEYPPGIYFLKIQNRVLKVIKI